MSELSAFSSPAVVRASSLDQGAHRSFLADVVIEHGPRDVLGKLFLRADTELRKLGILVSFASFGELLAVNKANSSSWAPVVSVFDPTVSDIGEANGFVLLGRNARGEVVCSTAGRFYSLAATNLKDECESLRFFYRDPERSRSATEKVSITAPSAATMTGQLVYGGATWYRPDFRKAGIMPALSTLARGISMTRWRPERVITFMSRRLVEAGVGRRGHFNNEEWDVTLIDTPVIPNGTYRGALIWAEQDHLWQCMRSYCDSPAVEAEVDGVVENRPTNQQRTA